MKPSAPSAPPQRRTPMPPRQRPLRQQSPKTAARDRRYAIRRKVFLARRPRCEVTLPHHCAGDATEVHHMAGRAPSVFFDESLWLPCCHNGHVQVTTHPWEAMAGGLSVSRHGRRAS